MSGSEAKPKWVRWFPADWRSNVGVGDLSASERGVYLELLFLQFDSGPFEYDPRRLARHCRLLPDEVEEAWRAIRPLFVRGEDGRWSNPKAQKERDWSLDQRSRKSEAGRRGAAARASKSAAQTGSASSSASSSATSSASGSATSSATRSATSNQNQNQNQNQIQGGEEGAPPPARERAPAPGAKKFAAGWPDRERHRLDDCGDDVAAAWGEWCDHLEARKRPTPNALNGHEAFCRELLDARGAAAVAAFLTECVESNAQGFVPWAKQRALKAPASLPPRTGGRRTFADMVEAGEITISEEAS